MGKGSQSASLFISMEKLFAQNLKNRVLVTPATKILLAVSAGLDSMVMLTLFRHIQDQFALEIAVGHVNHQLRSDAEKDVTFLREYCLTHNLEFYLENVDVKEAVLNSDESMEMSARRMRYEALKRIKTEARADLIATAHTASDQAETVLLRILEGTGVKGLQGIRVKRNDIIRPLLDFDRSAIEEYARIHNVPYRKDVTNQDLDIKRNRIRHELLPQIRQHINPNVNSALNRFSSIQSEVHELLEDSGHRAFEEALLEQSADQIILDLGKCQTYFTAILKTLFINCLAELGVPTHSLTFSQMEQLTHLVKAGKSGAQVTLPGDVIVMKDRKQLLFSRGKPWSEFSAPFTVGEFNHGSYRWQVTEQSAEQLSTLKNSEPWTEFFDKVRIEMLNPYWRNWQDGDSMIIPGGMTKKVSDIFVDAKLPVWEKHRRPLLVTEKKDVLWIPGIKRSAEAWITEKTKGIIQITVTKVI